MGYLVGAVLRTIDGLRTDIRLASRGMARTRGFALVALLSLAVGVGANTALFSIVHATVFRPVPGVTGHDRIVEILLKARDGTHAELTHPDLRDLQAADTPLESVAGWKIREGTLSDGQTGQSVRVMYSSSQYFPVLGVRMSLGRAFLPGEDVGAGQHPVAIVSHTLWQRSLGGRADVLGQTITLNRTPYTVVGVAPEEFRHHRVGDGVDLWAPLTQHPTMAGRVSWADDRGARWVEVLARLRPGATVGEANAALGTVFARLAQEHPVTNHDRSAIAASFGPFPANNRTGDMVAIGGLLALGGFVQLIICANLAGMLLARGASREREAAICAALGADRGRLIRRHLVDAALLATAGGAAGMAIAWQVTAMPSFAAFVGLRDIDVSPSGAVLLYSLLTIVGTALAVGLLPALRLSRPQIVGSLKDDVGVGSRRAGKFHRIAVSAQVGVTLLFLAVSAVFVAALSRMQGRDLGFDPRRLLVVSLDLTTQGYNEPAAGLPFIARLEDLVAAVPGVASVAVADGLPIDLSGNFTRVSRADGPDEPAARVVTEFTRVGPGFFPTIGARVLLGRGIDSSDTASSERVVVISRDLASRLWPGEEPVGRQLRVAIGREAVEPHTVVGVVAEVASSRPTESWPQLFVPLAQNFDRPRLVMLVKGHADPASLTHSIHSAILAADPRFVLPWAASSRALIERSLEPQRMTAATAAGLGLVALVLSAFGVYGLVAFVVSQRTREFGLRMALGARQAQVVGAVLREGVRLAIPGLVVGALAAGGLTLAMRSMLLGVAPLNPVAFGLVASLILAVVVVACAVPAGRAARVHPTAALRAQ